MAFTGVALAAPAGAPPPLARDKHRLATQLDDSGDPEKALPVIDEGLATAPRDLALLQLKGAVLLKLRDYSEAIAAYRAYIAAGATGQNRVEAQKIIRALSAALSTFLEITTAAGPATIFLDTKTQGVFCTAAPSCKRSILPGDYKVIAERPGFERWTGRVTVENDRTTKLDVALLEKPSQLTVRVTPADAQVRVGNEDYRGPMTVPAGSHPVSARQTGYVDGHLEAVAHEGKPIELAMTLTPLVPLRVEPVAAALQLDSGQPVVVQDGGVALPPGKQVIVGRAQGFRDRRVEVPAERPEGYKLEVVLERIPPPPPPLPPVPFPLRRKLAIGAAGLSVVTLVAGGFLWDDANRFNEDANIVCPTSPDPCVRAAHASQLRDRADLRRNGAYAGFAVGAGAAVAAAVLWVTGAPESRVAVTPRVGPVAGLDLSVRF